MRRCPESTCSYRFGGGHWRQKMSTPADFSRNDESLFSPLPPNADWWDFQEKGIKNKISTNFSKPLKFSFSSPWKVNKIQNSYFPHLFALLAETKVGKHKKKENLVFTSFPRLLEAGEEGIICITLISRNKKCCCRLSRMEFIFVFSRKKSFFFLSIFESGVQKKFFCLANPRAKFQLYVVL